MLAAASRDLQSLRREHQEASREERHHGEHVEVHAVGARRIAARLLERFHRSHVNAGRQEGRDARAHCLAVSPALKAHIEAVQLSEALEPPLRGGDVGQHFDAFDVQHPADLQLDRPVPDRQPHPIAFDELVRGRGEENFVGRQQLRPPLAQRIDADHPDAALGPRQPGVELDAGLAGTERSIRVIGIDALRERRPELLAPDKVLLSAAAAELVKGDRLRLAIGHRTVELQVSGVLDIKGVEVLTDIATAQWRLERLGQLNRLDVRLKRGADREAVRSSIAALLPPGVHVASVEALEQASSYPSRAYRVNLNVLAMVALFTGGFLVFSAQALEVARRRGEHALLRVLGLTAPGLSRLILLEAGVLGAVGGILGVALGYAFALAAVRASGADLGAGMFRGLSPT